MRLLAVIGAGSLLLIGSYLVIAACHSVRYWRHDPDDEETNE